MKITEKVVAVREGELLGEIDWNYDFKQHYTNMGTNEEGKQKATERDLARLKLIEANPDKWQATNDGGWPRCGWGNILAVGMYDGWPYWKPVPSVCIVSWAGTGKWCSFHNITDIRTKEEK